MSQFDQIINKKAREWGCSELMKVQTADASTKIPLSAPLLNWALYGGVPMDRIIEFFGVPGGGKSSTAIDVCKNAVNIFQKKYEADLVRLQKKAKEGIKSAAVELEDLKEAGPKKILYVDIEHGLDAEWLQTLGVDREKIEVMSPPDLAAEDLLQTIQELIETNEVGLVVLDSIPSLVPRAELEKKYGERTVSALAGLMTVFCRKIVPILTRYHCTLVLINQIRDNMDNPYVTNTPGGQAIKFYSSLRVEFRTGKPLDFLGNELPQSAENPAGYKIQCRIVKQKTAPFDRKSATYTLIAASGIREDIDYALLAIQKYNLISKTGGWFTMMNPRNGEILQDSDGKICKVNGQARVYEFLQSNQEYYNDLKRFIDADIMGEPSPFADDSDSDVEGAVTAEDLGL